MVIGCWQTFDRLYKPKASVFGIFKFLVSPIEDLRQLAQVWGIHLNI